MKYQHKYPVIEAEQYDGHRCPRILWAVEPDDPEQDWPGFHPESEGDPYKRYHTLPTTEFWPPHYDHNGNWTAAVLFITTPEGRKYARPNYWVCRDETGAIFLMNPAVFELYYEQNG